MDYRKRMILSGIIFTFSGFAMLVVNWESDFSFSMVLFSIVAFASFLSTFYFIIKKDIKQDYRKRMILNGIFSAILSSAMLAGIWEGNGPFSMILISTIIFSIFTLVSLVSTFYFIIKKDIKKPDYRNKQGKLPMEVIKPFYSNRTNILIYRMSLVLSLLLAVAAIWAASITAMVACVVLVFIQLLIIAPLFAVKLYM